MFVQLEALVREYHNTDMKPGKHVSNVRIQVRTTPRTGRESENEKHTQPHTYIEMEMERNR